MCANEFTNECKASTKHQFLRTKFHKRRSERNRLCFVKSLNDPNDPWDACATVSWLPPTRLFDVAATRKFYFDMHFALLSENLREREITPFFFRFDCVDGARCIFETLHTATVYIYIYIFLHILHWKADGMKSGRIKFAIFFAITFTEMLRVLFIKTYSHVTIATSAFRTYVIRII